MGVIVQKYGGKLVSNKENMKKVAKSIINSYSKGNKVVVVVSAIADTTDELNNKIYEITKEPNKREVDVVLSSGEQIAIGLLCIMLDSMGYKAISLAGWQAGVRTDNSYTNANITNIDTELINGYLENNYIVIVAGFQGVDNKNNITTLGRGGSDTTATQLAFYLNADICEIYKDTKCICTADPKLIPTARKLENINYNQMLELSKMGAKVLAYKSIEYAKEKNLNLVVKSVENDEIGTTISNKDSNCSLPIISCTKKSIDETKDMISFILNCNMKTDEFKTILQANNITDYFIEKTDKKISITLDKKIANSILRQIHDEFII